MVRTLQVASVNNTERYDDNKDSNHWEDVITGDHQEILEELLERLNNEDLDVDNSWYRLKEVNHIVNF